MKMTNEIPNLHATSQLLIYRVRMTCGHGEYRAMREETAGIPCLPWTDDRGILVAPYSKCSACTKGEQP